MQSQYAQIKKLKAQVDLTLRARPETKVSDTELVSFVGGKFKDN